MQPRSFTAGRLIYLKCGAINILFQAQGSFLVFLECDRPLELEFDPLSSLDKGSDVSPRAGSLVFHSRHILYLQQGQYRKEEVVLQGK